MNTAHQPYTVHQHSMADGNWGSGRNPIYVGAISDVS